MTAFHPNLKPPVGFDQGDEFADLHSAQFTPGTLDLRKTMRCSMAMHVLRAQSARPAPGPTQRSAAIPLLLPRRLLEHFRPVPRQKLRMRQALPALRLDQAGAVVGQQLRFGVVAAHAQVVPADAAAVFVGEQHFLPERGIAAGGALLSQS